MPFDSVLSAINAQTTISQRSTSSFRSGIRSACAALSNDQNDNPIRQPRNGSGITRCAKKKVPVNIAKTSAAASPADQEPTTLRASKPVARNQPTVARDTGSRAPNSFAPKTLIERASHQ